MVYITVPSLYSCTQASLKDDKDYDYIFLKTKTKTLQLFQHYIFILFSIQAQNMCCWGATQLPTDLVTWKGGGEKENRELR